MPSSPGDYQVTRDGRVMLRLVHYTWHGWQ